MLSLRNIYYLTISPLCRCDKDQCTTAHNCHCSGEDVVVPLAQRPQVSQPRHEAAVTQPLPL